MEKIKFRKFDEQAVRQTTSWRVLPQFITMRAPFVWTSELVEAHFSEVNILDPDYYKPIFDQCSFGSNNKFRLGEQKKYIDFLGRILGEFVEFVSSHGGDAEEFKHLALAELYGACNHQVYRTDCYWFADENPDIYDMVEKSKIRRRMDNPATLYLISELPESLGTSLGVEDRFKGLVRIMGRAYKTRIDMQGSGRLSQLSILELRESINSFERSLIATGHYMPEDGSPLYKKETVLDILQTKK